MPDSLATLANKLLQTKHDHSNKEKYDKYLQPNNVSFLDVPQINKPVWTSISRPARLTDSNLQFIQRDFLRSAIPVLNVMQKLNESRDNLVLDLPFNSQVCFKFELYIQIPSMFHAYVS